MPSKKKQHGNDLISAKCETFVFQQLPSIPTPKPISPNELNEVVEPLKVLWFSVFLVKISAIPGNARTILKIKNVYVKRLYWETFFSSRNSERSIALHKKQICSKRPKESFRSSFFFFCLRYRIFSLTYFAIERVNACIIYYFGGKKAVLQWIAIAVVHGTHESTVNHCRFNLSFP